MTFTSEEEQSDSKTLSFDGPTTTLSMTEEELQERQLQQPYISKDFRGATVSAVVMKQQNTKREEQFFQGTSTDVIAHHSSRFYRNFARISFCKVCKTVIELSYELVRNLISSQMVVFDHPAMKMESRELYTCLICDSIIGPHLNIEYHLRNHLKRNEIYYCVNCQENINSREICLVLEDVSKSIPIHLECFYREHEEKILTKISNKMDMPKCGNCLQPLGYPTSLVRRIIIRETEVDNFGTKHCFYRCGLCGYRDVKLKLIETHFLNHIQRKELRCRSCEVEKDDTAFSTEGAADFTDDDSSDVKLYDKELKEILESTEFEDIDSSHLTQVNSVAKSSNDNQED